MRLAVVTSQFPVEGDPNRGRPVLQSIEALSRLVPLEVFVPNARYPVGLAPRSYRYVEPAVSGSKRSVPARYLTYPTLPVLGRLLNGRSAGRTLFEPLQAFGPDLILSYWMYPDAYGAALVARRLGIPLVSGARGSDLRARDAVSLALTRRALRHSARVLAVSADLRRIAIEQFGVAAERSFVVPNGCDTRIFHSGDRESARTELGIPSGRLVLYVGRLVAAKGLRELLAAWCELAREDATLRLAFVGDGALRDELARTAAARGLGNRVMLPGSATPEQVAVWMRACDLLCLPSHTEGYPNVLVEALACGRPIVATPVGGIVEIVDEHNGAFAPVGDAAGLEVALRAVLSRQWNAHDLSRRFTRSWHDVAAETLAICEDALAMHARPRSKSVAG